MSSAYQHIHFSIDDRVARITFAKPPLNVFNIAMMREITSALTQCAERELVAIVFDADKSCRAFSAGVAVEEHVQEMIFQMLDAFHAIFRQLEQLAKPAIALVDGVEPSVAAAVFFALDGLIHLQPVIKDKAIAAGVRLHTSSTQQIVTNTALLPSFTRL